MEGKEGKEKEGRRKGRKKERRNHMFWGQLKLKYAVRYYLTFLFLLFVEVIIYYQINKLPLCYEERYSHI